jgi:hypothetical protein
MRKFAVAKGEHLNTKEKINASSASNGTRTFFSPGGSFADGAMIQSRLFKIGSSQAGYPDPQRCSGEVHVRD